MKKKEKKTLELEILELESRLSPRLLPSDDTMNCDEGGIGGAEC